MNITTISRLWSDKRTLWVFYTVAAVFVSIQKYGQPSKYEGYTAYENYVIFRNSFAHLWSGQNPYAAFPAEQWDLFKYSPAFALFMAPFSVLPDLIGLMVWNLLNALPLLAALWMLPLKNDQQKAVVAWVILVELVISLQNSQSNGLTAALMIGTLVALERKKYWMGAAAVAGAAFIKVFGIVAVLLCLFYPRKWSFLFKLSIVCLVLLLIPLVVVSPAHLWQVYQWWWQLLQQDHVASIGLSVQGFLQVWFDWQPSKMAITVFGVIVLLGSIAAATRQHPRSTDQAKYPLLVLASILIWVVIFNHKAESPTFIIAMSGVMLWYCSGGQSRWDQALTLLALIFVSLSPSDLFPRFIRDQYMQPYVVKVIPCILI